MGRKQQHPILARLGPLVQANSTRLLLGAAICLLVFCVAIKSAHLDSELSSWIQRTSRIQNELNFVESHIGKGSGSSGELLLQTPNEEDANVLSVDALMVHLEALGLATHVSVDLFEMTWTLKEICYTPTLPDFDMPVASILDRMMPCSIKTPLDCFWEGSKLLGPDQSVSTLSTMGLSSSKWTSLNPLPMVEAMRRNQPHAAFNYDSLIDWMRRVGITTGYQLKPCLDPTDANCPESAPNKLSGQAPDVGLQLTGGCHGFAANQMHWKEEEIVGGAMRNKSGHLVHASGLQSTIQLMGEQDMYEYWRRTYKVDKINDWSIEKAKLILDTWQLRFKEELQQFTQTSKAPNSYKIHTMTSKSMLEPINIDSLLDFSNFQLCFAIMTILACVVYPNFSQFNDQKSPQTDTTGRSRFVDYSVKQLRRISLALISSLIVGITLVASLGISSLMNLPFNMATTQILPPLALYYGFNQFITISNIYSQKLSSSPHEYVTTDCLIESFPIITIDSLSHVVALLASTIIPVPATRVFAFQVIIFILLASFVTMILTPSMLNTFLNTSGMKNESTKVPTDRPLSVLSESSKSKISRTVSPISKFTARKKKVSATQTKSNESYIEEQIFSRIQDDLKNIRADRNPQPANLNFSAHFGSDGLRTSLSLTTSQPTSIAYNDISKFPPKTDDINPERMHCNTKQMSNFQLPDLVIGSLPGFDDPPAVTDELTHAIKDPDSNNQVEVKEAAYSVLKRYSEGLARSRLIHTFICLTTLFILVSMIIHITDVEYSLRLEDIVAQGTPEHESFTIREDYFPVYNVFTITKGNFDYPTNQKLLHQFYEALKRVDGILIDDDSNRSKFWLIAFRDWLLELQSKFDGDRSKSLISVEGWAAEASEASKLAYKLLAQTGRQDNLIDKKQVMTNRLVDSNGIINPKAFYYYLTAWVINDPFTYANSEADFRPEPKIWNYNPDDLKIERARPLTYAQIPFQMKLPANHESLKRISEVRTVSQAFEQLNLPNFPTGIPFIFWDQFTNLDILLILSSVVGITSIFMLVGLVVADFRIAAITIIPTTLTLLELYGFLGYSSIPFNNILAVLLISAIGITSIQTVHFTTYFIRQRGDLITRACLAVRFRFRIVASSLVLFFICALVFRISKFDFMIKYSSLLFCLALLNTFNSLLLAPVLLSLLGPEYKVPSEEEIKCQRIESTTSLYGLKEKQKRFVYKKKKKRGYPRIQSKISLSTISEEAQSEAHTHDLKFDFSVKCY